MSQANKVKIFKVHFVLTTTGRQCNEGKLRLMLKPGKELDFNFHFISIQFERLVINFNPCPQSNSCLEANYFFLLSVFLSLSRQGQGQSCYQWPSGQSKPRFQSKTEICSAAQLSCFLRRRCSSSHNSLRGITHSVQFTFCSLRINPFQ